MKKKCVLAICIAFLLCFLAGAFAACKTNPLNPDGLDNYLAIDPDKEYQSVTGFGASAAWWAQTVPVGSQSATDLAESLYSEAGIALSIYRYNIGGGSWDYNAYNEHGAGDFVVFPEYRNTQSAFIADNYDESLSAAENFADPDNYDFSKDENALEFMKLCATQEGSTVERIILFANSPHYLLTVSGKTNGDYAYQSNLPAENYDAYCEYLIKYLDYVVNGLGLEVEAVSAINEPQHSWGGEDAPQEGCHYEPKELAAFYDKFYGYLKEFNAANGTNVKMDVFESGNYDVYKSKGRVMEYIYEMSKYDYFDEIDTISVHSYGSPTSVEARESFIYMLRNLYGDKINIEMSEICDMTAGLDAGMDSALWLSEVMNKDFVDLGARAWCWWMAASCDDYNDGIVTWMWGTEDGKVTPTKRYWVMGNYSKFLDTGDVRIEGSIDRASNGVFATVFKKADGRIVVVLTNAGDSEKKINLPAGYASLQAWETSADKDLENVYDGACGRAYTAAAGSVTTLILSK